jgi:hypothetical protein
MKRGMIAIMFLLSVTAARAGTNFPALADYPGPSCTKPGAKPELPPVTTSTVQSGSVTVTNTGRDVKDYNKQVAQYNETLHAYTACMNAYVANGQADMNMIRDKVNQAVAAGKVP